MASSTSGLRRVADADAARRDPTTRSIDPVTDKDLVGLVNTTVYTGSAASARAPEAVRWRASGMPDCPPMRVKSGGAHTSRCFLAEPVQVPIWIRRELHH